MSTSIDIVRQALGGAAVGDLDAARAAVTDDFVWHIPGTSQISGDIHGVEAWASHLARLFAAGLKPQVIAFLEGDGYVAALQRNVADNGDHHLDIPVITLYTLRDGRLARMDTFFGDQVAAEEFWNKAQL